MDYLEVISIPPKSTFNVGLTPASNATMQKLLGEPVSGKNYRVDGDCTPVDNPKLKALLSTHDFGPFAATGIRPAIDSMRGVLDRVKAEVADLHAILGTAGMHCARFTKIRQKNGKLKIGPGVSNHSWGTAIDLKLKGKLDPQGNGTTYRGLLVLSTYFNAAGWYWGAAFNVEDGMHFEASSRLMAEWKKIGAI